MKKFLTSIALMSIPGLALSACGGNSSSPSATASNSVADHAKASLATRFLSQSSKTSLTPIANASVASCVANGFVDTIGVPGLIGYGLIDAQGNAVTTATSNTHAASAKDAATMTDTFVKCIGDTALVAAFRAQVTNSRGLSPAAVTCMTNALTADTVHSYLLATLQGQQPPVRAALIKCSTHR